MLYLFELVFNELSLLHAEDAEIAPVLRLNAEARVLLHFSDRGTLAICFGRGDPLLRSQPNLVIIQGQLLVGGVKHLRDGICRLVIVTIDLDETLVKYKCLIKFSLHALHFSEELKSLEAVFELLLLQDDLEGFLDGDEITIKEVKLGHLELSAEVARVDLHSLLIPAECGVEIFLHVRDLAKSEGKVRAKDVDVPAERHQVGCWWLFEPLAELDGTIA